MKWTLLLLSLSVIVASAGHAQSVVPEPPISLFFSATTEEVSILVCPAGDGYAIANAMGFGGYTVDATLTTTLLDYQGIPVVFFPADRIWIEVEGLIFCEDGNIADHDSDFNGQTDFSLPLKGGGCAEDAETWGMLDGQPFGGSPNPLLNLNYNSADMNGDQVVNLTDVVLFADYYGGTYGYCADFYWDGVINLSDLVLFAPHLGHICP